jgi:folate-binding protein YgfZ
MTTPLAPRRRAEMNDSQQPAAAAVDVAAPPAWAALAVTGPDAKTFLQGQLTQDLRRLHPETPLRAALCTPQGRVTALPWLVEMPAADATSTVLLILPGDIADAVTTTLRRYLLRAKVRIVTDDARVAGCWLAADAAALDATCGKATAGALAARTDENGAWLRLGSHRLLRIDRAEAPVTTGAPPGCAPATPAAFELAAIAAGEPMVRAATRDRWVPQMLNLDALDGIGFAKGCYTGQEIVARTQHLGQIKRRMLRFGFIGAATPVAGDAIVADGAKAGEVVRAATLHGVGELLAVVPLDRASGALTLEGGAPLVPLALPYAVKGA